MSDTTLTEAITEIDGWRQAAADTTELAADYPGATTRTSEREQAFAEVVAYLQGLDTAACEPGVTA